MKTRKRAQEFSDEEVDDTRTDRELGRDWAKWLVETVGIPATHLSDLPASGEYDEGFYEQLKLFKQDSQKSTDTEGVEAKMSAKKRAQEFSDEEVQEQPELEEFQDYSEPEQSHEARELLLYAENDADLYRQRYKPMVANLLQKMEKGTFDYDKSIKMWEYLVLDAAKKYSKEFSTGSDWKTTFPPAIRREVAEAFAQQFVIDAESGELGDWREWKASKKAQFEAVEDEVEVEEIDLDELNEDEFEDDSEFGEDEVKAPSKDDALEWVKENPEPDMDAVSVWVEENDFDADAAHEVLFSLVTEYIDMLEEDFEDLEEGIEDLEEGFEEISGSHRTAQVDEMFYRVDRAGNAVLFEADGSSVTRLDANVYPVGSDLSARYEHPEGIVLELEDAKGLGIPSE